MVYVTSSLCLDQECDTCLLQFEQTTGTEVKTLQVSERLTFPGSEMASENTFWQICSVERDIFVSRYYKKAFVPVRTDSVQVEPCTVLICNRVILTVEFFLQEFGAIIYKDILYTLFQVVSSLCKLKEFPVDIRYLYTTYVDGSWTVVYITPEMLKLTILELLLLDEIKMSNTMDFFILSPECVSV